MTHHPGLSPGSDKEANGPRRSRATPARVAGGYLIASVAWILLSDRVLEWADIYGREAHWVQSAKGTMFVTLSAGLLYWYVRREFRAMDRAQERAREREELLGNIITHIPCGVFWKDRASVYLGCNDQIARDHGFGSPDQVVGRTDHELEVDPAEASFYRACDRQVMQNGKPIFNLEETQTRLGKQRILLTNKVPLRSATGAVVGVLGIYQDITDLKQAEERVRERERLLRAVVEAADGVPYARDYVGERFEYVGPGIEGLLGLPPDDLTPARWEAMAQEFILLGTTETLTPAEANRRFREDPSPVWQADVRVRTADGSERWVFNAAVKGFDDQGRVIRSWGMLQDITTRKQAEEEREKFVALVEHSAEFVAMATLDGRILYVNPAGRQLVGLDSPGQEQDTRVEDYVPATVAALYRDTAFPLALAGGRWEGEVQFRHFRTGQLLDVRQCVFAVRMPGNGVPFCLATVARDVTGEKRLEEQYRQAQKMEAVGRLAGGIAHDFNNLLTVITGYADLVLDSLHTHDTSRPMVREIKKAGERASDLTQQLLAFSRKQILQQKVLDLGVVVADLGNMLRRVIGEDVELATRAAPGLCRVKADPGQVEQVVLNLAFNARDAMPTGGRLTIETRNVTLDGGHADDGSEVPPGPYVLLRVTDTGCGMTEEVKAKVFEPFFTTKEVGKGTGLGLATVYGIVKQSGGHIGVASRVGAGTTFSIYFPAIENAPPVVERPAGDGIPPCGTETVLVVEDEEAVRGLARLTLQRLGYTVLAAASGEEAAAVAGHPGTRIDLLLTDVVMPTQGGRVLAEQLRDDRPGLKVVFMSGYTDDAVVRHGVKHDRVNFLPKPFSAAQLARKVREVLDSGL